MLIWEQTGSLLFYYDWISMKYILALINLDKSALSSSFGTIRTICLLRPSHRTTFILLLSAILCLCAISRCNDQITGPRRLSQNWIIVGVGPVKIIFRRRKRRKDWNRLARYPFYIKLWQINKQQIREYA